MIVGWPFEVKIERFINLAFIWASACNEASSVKFCGPKIKEYSVILTAFMKWIKRCKQIKNFSLFQFLQATYNYMQWHCFTDNCKIKSC